MRQFIQLSHKYIMMNVNEKGAIGLIEVIRDLTKKGYECFTPMHDYSKIDLIAVNKSWQTIRVQVKYRTLVRGVIDIGFCSVVNGKKIPIDTTAIDGWAVYCPEIDKVVYINKTDVDVTKGGIAFRLSEGKNTFNATKEKRKLYSEFRDVDEWFKSTPC